MKRLYTYITISLLLIVIPRISYSEEYIGTDKFPMSQSTHTYDVTVSPDFTNANWYIYDVGTNSLNVETRLAKIDLGEGVENSSNSSVREITVNFDARFTVGVDYVLVYRETAEIDQVTCFDYRFYELKISPQLDIDLDEEIADDCPAGGSDLESIEDAITSTFNFEVQLTSDYNCNYEFKLKISATADGGTSLDDGVIQSVEIKENNASGDIVYSESGLSTSDYEQQNYKLVTNTTTETVNVLYVCFVMTHSQGFEQEIAVSLYSKGSYLEVDVDSQPESGSFKIYRIPAAGDIVAN